MTEELVEVTVQVNGLDYEQSVEPRLLLSDFLRQRLGLTGTHVGCEHGVCGACTVLVDGTSVRSCLMLAAQVSGSRIETVESLATSDGLHPLQQSFKENFALQCGFCTPGILMATVDFLNVQSQPSRSEIAEMLSGQICRCTGYTSIIEAIYRYSRTRGRA